MVSSGYEDQVKAIKDIFSRLQKISPLYAAQLKVDQLNMEARDALGISKEVQIADYVIWELKKNISLLPEPNKTEFNAKLEKSMTRLSEFKNQYGETVYLFLGDIDLEVQVLLGKISFITGERAIIEKLMIDRIPGVVRERSEEIAQLDKVYSPSLWEKTCKAAYNRSLHYGLTQSEKDRIENQMKPESLRRSEKALLEIFGSELTSRIIGYVNTMQIGGPLSLPEYVEKMEKSMDYHLIEAKKTDRTLLDQYELISSLSRDEDGAIEDFCNSWIFNPLRDSVSGNSVILSPYSAKHYYVGLSIAIHEMGHAASVALDLLKRRGVSITPFEEIRECISENYKDSDRMATYDHSIHADKLWTEEDWADSFSSYTIKDLNVNNMCGFLGASPKHDYVTMSERSADTHSPTFYRILNIDIHLGNESPNQCKAPLETQYSGTKFKDCITPFTQKQ